MNIDKTRMEHAYNNRHIPEYQSELMSNFMQLARYHANRLSINREIYDDYVQEVVMTAIKSLEKYSASKNSNPFSYFYKVIYMRLLWLLRRDHNKNLRKPTTYSIEVVESKSDENTSLNHIFDSTIADIQAIENRISLTNDESESILLEKSIKKLKKQQKGESTVEIGGMVASRADLVQIVKDAKEKYKHPDNNLSMESLIKKLYTEKKQENV